MTSQRSLVVHDDAYMGSGRFDIDEFIGRGFIAPLGQEAAASRSLEVGAYIAHSQMLNWQAYLRDREG